MQLVIQLPENKNGDYIVMYKMNGCYIATGAKFKSKSKAIAHVRDQIYNTLVSYSEVVVFWDDSEKAWDNGTTYTELKLKPTQKRKVAC